MSPSADHLLEAAEVRLVGGQVLGERVFGARDRGAGQAVGGVKKDVLWRSPNWA